MRVIAGLAKGRLLKPVPGTGTRPVTDRVKESVFDILAGEVPESDFLDLFAGTGGIGIEALSRGANRATFVEMNPRAITVIRDNLQTTGLNGKARVVRQDVFRFIASEPERYDIVYVAPPQYQGLWRKALELLDSENSPAADLIIVQIYPKEFESVPLQFFTLEDSRKYGSTLVCFYRRLGQETD